MLTTAESGWQRFWRRFLHRRSLPLLLLLSIVLLSLDRSGADFFQRGKLWLADAAAPVLQASAFSRHLSDGFRRGIADYLALASSNESLRAENARLQEWRALAVDLRRRLARYEDMLHVVDLPESSFLTARLLGEVGGPFEQAAILQAGQTHGIAYGHGVVDTRGLVGRIVGVGQKTSRVLLLTDFNSRVPVLLEPGGARGIASGNGSDTLRLEYLPEDTGVSLGDRVVTSGDGGFLPAGLLVGMVVDFDDDQPIVEPFMQTGRLEWVRVLIQSSVHDVPRSAGAGPLSRGAPLAATAAPKGVVR